ncbi:transcription regulator of CopAB ATPases [Secundilactobacillus oryzae JCM 18671]|uniref:Transcription regulator of CopAB ATPases n=1 Tax=Secundilactobacillus oryzae JCM 18671 TaxID=1291743 RepID=A0A081BGJ5_9LACO|nr:transcription regulator of CopAB ATPases [Secundilactobacillus oryzae JCM 18671]
MTETLNISDAEWEVMRIVWTLGEAKSHDIIDNLTQKKDWKASTIKTLISRLVKKDYLAADKNANSFTYRPLISQNESNDQVGLSVFDNMCAMCAGHTLLKVVDNVELSKNDIQSLITLLEKRLETAPDEVTCNCLAMSAGKEEI